ncbi:hypothetical protein ACHHYP_03018 [Achlya hypogyna]|uniref:Uncharacterized protein n=1 Tax=Achlya hypogyna TaxID=1202772 RepID=A0A1V9Z4N3_ACHHY|nr:hypothetical protein ACHHYP_03018 [Achlya hypogyna]
MQRRLRLDDLEATRGIDSSGEHLQTLSELAEVQEKYYRLGAEMRRLRQSQHLGLELREELDHVRALLLSSQGREEQLARDLKAARRELAAAQRQADDALEERQSPAPDVWRAIESRREAELSALLDDQRRQLQALEAEAAAKAADAHHYASLCSELQAHCDRLEDTVRTLRAEVPTPSAQAMGQLVRDNQRLVALLMDTQEFTQFKFYMTLDGVSYCAPESFGEAGPTPPEAAPAQDNLLAWGRLVRSLSDVYPPPAPTAPTSFAAEEKQWVPTKVLGIVSAFRTEYAPAVPPPAFARMVKAVNRVWHKTCAAKLQQLRDATARETAELRRRAKQAVPYEAVVHAREIHRLKSEIVQLYHDKLRASKADDVRAAAKPVRRWPPQ